jgi:hypothetical protein
MEAKGSVCLFHLFSPFDFCFWLCIIERIPAVIWKKRKFSSVSRSSTQHFTEAFRRRRLTLSSFRLQAPLPNNRAWRSVHLPGLLRKGSCFCILARSHEYIGFSEHNIITYSTILISRSVFPICLYKQ